jgi:hypothetical protein
MKHQLQKKESRFFSGFSPDFLRIFSQISQPQNHEPTVGCKDERAAS